MIIVDNNQIIFIYFIINDLILVYIKIFVIKIIVCFPLIFRYVI